MQILKQSTATTIYVGPVLDSAGAAVTTAVLGDFRIVKNGTAATLSGATVTHDANGYYTIALTTSNTDTLGRLTVAVGNTAMSMATHRYTVMLASVFDALLTNATNASGGLVTATAAITGLAGTIATTTNITSATGIVLAATTHTGATIPTVTTVTNRVSANTDQWGGVVVTGMPMPTYTQPTGFLAATFPGMVASTTNITTVGAVSGSVGSISGVTFPANFGVLVINSSGHISRVTLVDTTTTNTDMRGTDGAALASVWTPTVAGRIDAAMSTLATQASVDALAGFVDTEVAAIKAKTDNLPAAPAAVGDIPTVGDIADAVLDELLSGHTIPGSVGTALAAASSAGDPWSTLLPGSYPSGSAGAIIGAILAAIDAVPTAAEIDAVLTAAHGSGSWVGAGSTSSGGDASGLSSEILAAAGGPSEVQNGDQKVKARSIAELIEADKHLAAKTAAADPGSIFRRITPPGAR